MRRMLFEKTGRAVWMSHLDTMRLMQRAFRRAGVVLHHSQGYTPHAYVSLILPLSVGAQSLCEIMEYELDEAMDITPEAMNAVLPEGVRVREVYESERKAKLLSRLRVMLTLEYDEKLPENGCERISDLLNGDHILVEKRTKRGIEETDIRPMIHSFGMLADGNTILLNVEVSAQNPSLNPTLIAAAIAHYLPDCKPDGVSYCRLEVYDDMGEVFR